MVVEIVFMYWGLVVRLDCESWSKIFLEKNPTYLSKIKHINVPYHFIRDMVEEKKVLLWKVDTLKNFVNSLIKFDSTKKFSWCKEEMAIASLNLWHYKSQASIFSKQNKWENLGYVLYSLHMNHIHSCMRH